MKSSQTRIAFGVKVLYYSSFMTKEVTLFFKNQEKKKQKVRFTNVLSNYALFLKLIFCKISFVLWS